MYCLWMYLASWSVLSDTLCYIKLLKYWSQFFVLLQLRLLKIDDDNIFIPLLFWLLSPQLVSFIISEGDKKDIHEKGTINFLFLVHFY